MFADLILGLSLVFGPYGDEQLECLADNIYHEARGESLEGQIAVTHVVFNRTHATNFPSDYCAVVKQGKHVNGNPLKNQCQFSWYCDGLSDTPQDNEKYNEAVKMARTAWQIYYLSNMDFSSGADHYHADYVDPYWNADMTQTAQIDTHIFYKSK